MADLDYQNLAAQLAVALIPTLGIQPDAGAANDEWHARLQRSLLRVSGIIAYEAPKAMQKAAADQEYFR